jgi:hypothetical protein
MVKRARIAPAAVVETTGQYLYHRDALSSAGVWPDRPVDRRREVWLPVYARRHGLREAQFEEILRRHLGHRLELPTPAPPDRLETEGIGRRIGNRWLLNVRATDALLAPPRRSSSESTVEELLPDHPGYSSPEALASALRRAGITGRKVVADDGRPQWVVDAEAARTTVGGRHSPASRYAELPRGVEASFRAKVGPFRLRAPTERASLTANNAAWLLEMEERRVTDLVRLETDGSDAGVPISWVEARLIERADYEGLLLLAETLDGAFILDITENRTKALLRLLEKGGKSV